MKRLVEWCDDYLNIIRYISRENPDAAERVADRIDEIAATLADFAAGRAGRVTGTYEKVLPNLPYILIYEMLAVPVAARWSPFCTSSTANAIDGPYSGSTK